MIGNIGRQFCLIKFYSQIMQNHSIKNNDDLIQGIRSILSNYCCSFSEDEQVLLNDCIKKLEEPDNIEELHTRADLCIKVVGILLKVFTVAGHFKNLF
jgi:hypothetical protein